MKRSVSLLLATIAIVVAPIWAAVESSRLADSIREERGWVCGLPILAISIIALLGASVFSAGSLAFVIFAYRELPVPRPTSRRIELFVVSAPLLAGVILATVLTLSGA